MQPDSGLREVRLQCSITFDPAAETDFEIFPPGSAVFAFFPEEKRGLPLQPYLSYTRDFRRRLRRLLGEPPSSSRRLNLRPVTRRIDYQSTGSAFESQWLLFLLNQFHYPRHFRRRLRLKSPALLKVNLRNRFPRCYPTRQMRPDGSRYYGPFPSRAVAERFAAEFLDLFKIRRCLPDLEPDPSHPGCIYSQMHMCLAPCFKGCTDEEYQQEVQRALRFLDSEGAQLVSEIETEREKASANLEFEQAAHLHRKIEKVRDVQRLKPILVREISSLHAILILPGAQEKSVVFFRVTGGELHGPAALSLEENVSAPVSLDQQIQQSLGSLAPEADSTRRPTPPRTLPPWEHLSLLARWYYSSFRTGNLVMLPASQEIPHARLIRLCRKMISQTPEAPPA
ncbi:MAG: UvrB/UvrC motif-containing protein [Terriglobia bacterium]